MNKVLIAFLACTLLISACGNDLLESPSEFQVPTLPDSPTNPRTKAGVQLGRMLFYETKLSRTNDLSCASCHDQELAFSDNNPVSFGVDDLQGTRQAMTLFNLAFTQNGFFWDGRAEILRHQSLLPIQDSVELDETLENVISKLNNEEMYLDQFDLAFGNNQITEEKMGLALEQFLTSIVSDNSRFDQFNRGEIQLTSSEMEGARLFQRAGCDNCHGGFNFNDTRFLNNGLDFEDEMKDLGRELVTGRPIDRGQFKVPSLRNIATSAPYMHDGRFSTLEEVMDHYSKGVKDTNTTAGEVRGGFDMTNQERSDIVEFLHTLTDNEYLTNPDYASPF